MRKRRAFERNALAHKAKLEQCIRDRLSLEQAAAELKISPGSVNAYMRFLGLKRIPATYTPDPRANEMLAMRHDGATLEQIGAKFDITRERVRQILARTFPDVAIQTNRQRPCAYCGSLHRPSKSRSDFCSKKCMESNRRGRMFWCRDIAVRIMQMRSQSMTWEQIAASIMPGASPQVFRSALQYHKAKLFSTPEQEYYFPKLGQPHFKPQPTSSTKP